MTIISGWQQGTQQDRTGHSAEFNLSDSSFQLPEHGVVVENLPRSNRTRLAQHRSHGLSAMQRNFLRWLDSAQMALGWAVILVILAIASGVYLQQVSHTAITGRSAELLEIELSELRYDNNQVRQQISKGQSLNVMDTRTIANSQVFVAPAISAEDYIHIVIPAAQISAPPLVDAPALPPETFTDALRLYIAGYFSALGRGVADGE